VMLYVAMAVLFQLVPTTWWTYEFAGHNDSARKEVRGFQRYRSRFCAKYPLKPVKIMPFAQNPARYQSLTLS
jgi:hypothetical protein